MTQHFSSGLGYGPEHYTLWPLTVDKFWSKKARTGSAADPQKSEENGKRNPLWLGVGEHTGWNEERTFDGQRSGRPRPPWLGAIPPSDGLTPESSLHMSAVLLSIRSTTLSTVGEGNGMKNSCYATTPPQK